MDIYDVKESDWKLLRKLVPGWQEKALFVPSSIATEIVSTAIGSTEVFCELYHITIATPVVKKNIMARIEKCFEDCNFKVDKAV